MEQEVGKKVWRENETKRDKTMLCNMFLQSEERKKKIRARTSPFPHRQISMQPRTMDCEGPTFVLDHVYHDSRLSRAPTSPLSELPLSAIISHLLEGAQRFRGHLSESSRCRMREHRLALMMPLLLLLYVVVLV